VLVIADERKKKEEGVKSHVRRNITEGGSLRSGKGIAGQ
jgi:hypothetical protein